VVRSLDPVDISINEVGSHDQRKPPGRTRTGLGRRSASTSTFVGEIPWTGSNVAPSVPRK
jgi:hypothetical protein